jgi:hypothetical protein
MVLIGRKNEEVKVSNDGRVCMPDPLSYVIQVNNTIQEMSKETMCKLAYAMLELVGEGEEDLVIEVQGRQ